MTPLLRYRQTAQLENLEFEGVWPMAAGAGYGKTPDSPPHMSHNQL